ncbi:hypothetical protein ACDA63_02085 [Uliginosibacterium sp. sgz301328]|uniref:hypothetical protein n=1 Tax=Uliginosibacterium sp. sgz301328 TaxID=3243764 RepID=UPI00359E1020
MFGSATLEVAAGLTIVFLVLSVACTAMREIIEARMKMRAVTLERALREMFQDPDGRGLTREFFAHPLIFALYRGGYDPTRLRNGRMPANSNLPSYIPSRSFALALLDIVARPAGQASVELSPEYLRTAIASFGCAPVRRIMQGACDASRGDLDGVRRYLETWYDTAMDRASGWYRRRTQGVIFALGLTMAVVLNVDTLRVARTLYEQAAVRVALVEDGARIADLLSGQPASDVVVSTLFERSLPMGWSAREFQGGARDIVLRLALAIPGWLLTALSISLGAPFWFDVLNRVTVIRSTVKPHEKSPEEPSQDGGRTSIQGEGR